MAQDSKRLTVMTPFANHIIIGFDIVTAEHVTEHELRD